MKKLTVTIYVFPSAAARAGKSSVGEHSLVLSDEDLATLTEDQRDTLARHLASEFPWSSPLYQDGPAVAEANLESLTILLDARRTKVLTDKAREEVEQAAKRDANSLAYARALEYLRTCPIEEISLDLKVVDCAYLKFRQYIADSALHKIYAVDAVNRRAERESYDLDQQALEATAAAARQADREAMEATERAQCREILLDLAPEMIPVWEAGLAVRGTVHEIMESWLALTIARKLGLESLPRIRVEGCEGRRVYLDNNTPYGGGFSPTQYTETRAILAIVAELPVKAKATVYPSYSYRTSTCDDDPSDIDSDDDVKINGPLCAEIEARVGGFDVDVSFPLGD